MGLTRLQLFRSLRVVQDGPQLEKITKAAYEQLEDAIWRSMPKKRATSFWASSFPITEKSCGRQALYSLMNTPPPEPFSIRSRAIVEMGKAAEYQIVYRWGKAGYTIGGSVPLVEGDEIHQLALQDPDTWLSGNLDAALDLRPQYDSVLPVDIKSKTDEAIKKMQVAALDYEERHYAQIQSYIYLCTLYHEEMGWADMGLQPARGASLYYVSRENPRNTCEFYFPANWPLINAALDRMRDWKEAFLSDRLPPRDKAWRWTQEPCKWCVFKKFGCKPDNKDKVATLSGSNIIQWSNEQTDYSLEQMKEKVLARWI